MLRSDDLAFFARVATAGGFGLAASELGVEVADVRRRVAALEASLGVRLVDDDEELRLTEAGHALAASLSTAASRQRRAQKARGQTRARAERRPAVEAPPLGLAPTPEPGLSARIAATPLLVATVLPDIVTAFLQTDADCRLVVGTDLLDPEVALGHAWRVGAPPRGALARTRLRLVASPAWIAAHGAPRTVEDVVRTPALVWPLGHGSARWPLRRGGRLEEVPLRARLRSTDLATVRGAALAGLGPTVLPDAAIADDLAAGLLVAMLDAELGQLGEIVLHHPHEGVSEAAGAFVRFALSRLGAR